jgi:hypothetical protein
MKIGTDPTIQLQLLIPQGPNSVIRLWKAWENMGNVGEKNGEIEEARKTW